MVAYLRQPTLETLGLGTVLEIFERGALPVSTAALVEEVFGPPEERGSLVISGASGIVGAGKAVQLGMRLLPYGVRVVGLDFPGAPDGLDQQYQGMVASFGRAKADAVMGNIVRLTYDGKSLPSELASLRPRFVLEAIPEVLELKRAHYALLRESFPDIEIRSVTSGFPARELGVGVAHPAFPHQINKIWEVVEDKPSAITKLFWALGLIPLPVSDHWSFVLDVLFCGVTLAALRYQDASNMPVWKIDKHVRKLCGPNPLRAHDAIGAKGATFLTWSCLHHLSETYGELFTPTQTLVQQKERDLNWYPMNHFRPLVDWPLAEADMPEFKAWILGPLLQMTSLMVHEQRAHLAHINAISELCAQFRPGMIATARNMGEAEAKAIVADYHALHPEAADESWHPEVLTEMDGPAWQQLYVNAEHNGEVGVLTISRETYSWDVDAELNRAIDWLKGEGIDKVILTGDFHLSTQMVGADTTAFFGALEDVEQGRAITRGWSTTARRLQDDFATSVGFINGKRCLGGFLELFVHCHYVVSVPDAKLGWPEVTLPVVPGMEGCHWPLRKTDASRWPALLGMLLSGRSVPASKLVGTLVDFAAPMNEALSMVWTIVSGGSHDIPLRPLKTEALHGVPSELADLAPAGSPGTVAGRAAIVDTVQRSCAVSLDEALNLQADLAADFLVSKPCNRGAVGAEFVKTMKV